jgi:predicted GNAT family acetyltransferase
VSPIRPDPGADPAIEVVDEAEAGRYVLRIDGREVGYATYRLADADQRTLVVPHVQVDPAHEGQGHGSRLMRGLLDDLRATGRTIVPVCSFAAAYVAARPDDHDLLAGS